MNIFNRQVSWVLILLTLLFLLPVASAWYIYYQPDRLGLNTTSSGVLIEPSFPLATLNLTTNTGAPFIQENTPRQWLLLYLQPHCNSFCQVQLDHIQDSRLALGKNMLRVRTILVTLPGQEDNSLQAYLNQHPGVTHLLADHNTFTSLSQYLPDDEYDSANNLIVVDPLGNALMRYNNEVYSTVIYKDLRHLLKASQIG